MLTPPPGSRENQEPKAQFRASAEPVCDPRVEALVRLLARRAAEEDYTALLSAEAARPTAREKSPS